METTQLPILSLEQITRFWSHVDVRTADECWQWKLGRTTGGYGKVSINHRTFIASRVMYFITTGADPGPLLVCHTCDKPPCCNPSHLFLGDEAANTNDCKTKGRLNTARGDKHGSRTMPESRRRGSAHTSTTLTEDDVREVWRLYASGTVTQPEIAGHFGVAREVITSILRRRTWVHVPLPDGITPEAIRATAKRHQSPGKLDDSKVREIRALSRDRTMTRSEIAERFGISVGMIDLIRAGKAWKHVK